jgi:hypothetical protein
MMVGGGAKRSAHVVWADHAFEGRTSCVSLRQAGQHLAERLVGCEHAHGCHLTLSSSPIGGSGTRRRRPPLEIIFGPQGNGSMTTEPLPVDGSSLRHLESSKQLLRWSQSLIASLKRQLTMSAPSPRHATPDLVTGEDQHQSAWLISTWDDLTAGFNRLHRIGVLREDVDPATLATSFLAALQGGYLLSLTARDVAPLEIAVDMALLQLADSLSQGADLPPRA